MRWMAALSWRLPVRLRRCRSWLPDQTGSEAVHVVAGEGVFGLKATDVGDLSHDLGGRESSDAWERQQVRRELGNAS